MLNRSILFNRLLSACNIGHINVENRDRDRSVTRLIHDGR